MREKDITQKDFFTNEERFADFTAFGKILKTVFEFYAAGKDKKSFRNYMVEHRDDVDSLDRESKFFLATMLGKKRLAKELLKKRNQEERSICKAIDDLIVDKANEMIEQYLSDKEKREERSCKAINDLIEDGVKEFRVEYEETIAELHRQLEEQKIQSMLEIERLKAQLAAYA